MSVQIVVSQKGPLPITATFQALGDLTMTLVVHGSVWTQSSNQLIGIVIQLDGQTIGQAQIFSNGSATHRAVVPAYIPVNLSYGQHKLTLSALPSGGTTSDFNDFYTAVLHY
jgi:hypothetical protein